jgi:poly(3-hydroxyoctanoate) depolymerase
MFMNNILRLVHGLPRINRANNIKMVQVGKRRLHMAIHPGNGKALPLLLLNGIGTNIEMFDPFVEELDPELEVIRFDVPGVGGSPAPLFPLRMKSLARLTARLLDQLGYRQVDVLGASWGGALAQQFAHQYPDRCRRLILASTSAGAFMIPGRFSVLTKMISPERFMRPDYMLAIAPSLYGGRIRSDTSLVRKLLHKVRAPSGLGYYWQLLGSMGWTSIHWLACLRQPTLIIAGDDDPIVPSINAKIMAWLIPKSTLRIIKNGGHLYLLTDAKEAANLVQEFLGFEDPSPGSAVRTGQH